MSDFSTDQMHVRATERIAHSFIDHRAIWGSGQWSFWREPMHTCVVRKIGELSAEGWRWPSDFRSLHRIPA